MFDNHLKTAKIGQYLNRPNGFAFEEITPLVVYHMLKKDFILWAEKNNKNICYKVKVGPVFLQQKGNVWETFEDEEMPSEKTTGWIISSVIN